MVGAFLTAAWIERKYSSHNGRVTSAKLSQAYTHTASLAKYLYTENCQPSICQSIPCMSEYP
uniref:Uncharacterized protein n=1 Tax=Arion vulgaris TaxID=1028688 RepID=A0A0B7BN49_9EUPU